MSLWQQNRSDFLLLVRSFCSVTAAHLCAIGLLFIAHGSSQKCSLTVTNRLLKAKNVVFLPLHKRMSSALVGRSKQAGAQIFASKKSTAPVKKTAQQKKTNTRLAQKPSTSLAQKTKKSFAKKNSSSKKKTSPKPPVIPVEKPVIQRELEQIVHHDIPVATALDVAQDVIYIGQECDALILYEQIQEEVVRCWHPPIGLDPHLACTVSVQVSWQGNIDVCKITQSSGVLAYDISTRCALSAMVFPRLTYGKEIIITFKQEQES